MIHVITPFRKDKDVGLAYNEAVGSIPDGDWACLLDHDAMFTTYQWHDQLEAAIDSEPNAGMFTGVTNRIYCPWQRAHGAPENHDMLLHRKYGAERAQNRYLLDVTDAHGLGGFIMLISKRAWLQVGGFVERALLCVDHNFHFALRRAGLKVWCIEGLYLYHYRRALGEAYGQGANIAINPETGEKCSKTCNLPTPIPHIRTLM